MHIKKFYISGFGHFHDIKSPEFSPNLNVIFGANEAGKSTIMNFIHSIFYGLKSRENPPLRGGQHGGKIYLTDEQARLYTIERLRTSKRITGELQVVDEDGLDASIKWSQTIGQIDRSVFRSLYWLTHGEIDRLSVEQDQLSGYIYGVSLGTTGVNYLDSIRKLDVKRDQMFKRQGAKPVINQLLIKLEAINEQHKELITEQLSYNDITNKHSELMEQVQQLELQEHEINNELLYYRKLERAWSYWETYSAAQETQSEIREHLHWQAWEEHKSLIEQLMQEIPVYQHNTIQFQELQQQLERANDRVEVAIDNLGLNWDENRLMQFQTGSTIKEHIRKQQHALSSIEQNELYQQRLVNDAEKVCINNKSNKMSYLDVFVQPIIWTMLLVGIWSIFRSMSNESWLSEQFLVMLSAGLIIAVWGYAGLRLINKNKAKNIAESRKLAEQNQLELIRQQKKQHILEWEALLLDREMPEYISPDEMMSIVVEIERIKDYIRQKIEISNRLADSEQKVGSYLQQVKMVLEQLNVTRQNDKYDSKDKIYDSKDMIYDSEYAVIQLEQLYKKVSYQQQLMDEARHAMKLIVKPEHQLEQLIEQLQQTNIINIGEHLQELQSAADGNRAQQKHLQELIGKLSQQQERLATDNRIADLNLNRSQSEQQLNQTVKEWSVATIAKWGLEKAKEQFEIEHQPEVLKAASELFETLTEGRYRRILLPIGENQVRIENDANSWLLPEQLSQGTKEQLFIAFRLGFLQQLKEHSIICPIFMDDIFVNFDTKRLRLAVKTLKAWSKQHQIFFFTCHDHILQEFINTGTDNIYYLKEQMLSIKQ